MIIRYYRVEESVDYFSIQYVDFKNETNPRTIADELWYALDINLTFNTLKEAQTKIRQLKTPIKYHY